MVEGITPIFTFFSSNNRRRLAGSTISSDGIRPCLDSMNSVYGPRAVSGCLLVLEVHLVLESDLAEVRIGL